MLVKSRILFSLALAGLLTLAMGSDAHALLTMLVQEDGGSLVTIEDGGPLDVDGIVNGSITADVAAADFTTNLTAFTFAGLSATSNALDGAGDAAVVTQTGTATLASGFSGTASIAVVAFDTDFSFPLTPTFLNSSASDTFSNTSAGDNRSFQSYFDQSNTAPVDTTLPGTPSPLLAFAAPAGVGPFSTSGDAATTILGAGATTPFALSNITLITLTGTGGATQPSDQFTGSTSVVVPEPTSVLSLVFGLPALGLVLRRRRAA